MKKLLIIAITVLLCAGPINATTYYWDSGSAYYPIGTVDDGDPLGIVTSTSLSGIWAMYNRAVKQNKQH